MALQALTWKTPLGPRSWLSWTEGPYGMAWDVMGAGGVGPTRVWYLLWIWASEEEPTAGLPWVAAVANEVVVAARAAEGAAAMEARAVGDAAAVAGAAGDVATTIGAAGDAAAATGLQRVRRNCAPKAGNHEDRGSSPWLG